MSTPLFCGTCGKAIPSGKKFCPECEGPTSHSGGSRTTVTDYRERPPRRGISRGLIALLVGLVVLLIVGSVGIYYTAVLRPSQLQAQASATAQAQSTATAHAQQVTATTQTQQTDATATIQAQMNTTATAQAQANATAIAIAIGPPIGFSVTTLHDGQVIQQGVPFTIKGTYSVKGSGQVWVLLEDGIRQYYLQNPSVGFQAGGQWVAENIIPVKGITMVDFFYVTLEGNKVFDQKVANNDFAAFPKSKLPDGSLMLGKSIPITLQG